MRTVMPEVLDLALTQAIDRYMELEPHLVTSAIAQDGWPEQTATLLESLLKYTECVECGGVIDLIHIARALSNCSFIKPICDCGEGS